MAQPQPNSLPVALVVSADRYKSAFFKRSLKGLFHVIDASDNFAAVDWLKSVQASIIILDEKTLSNTWPLISEHIRALAGYRDVPIFLITNNLKKNFLVKAMNLGISDFLNEPFDSDEIFQRILAASHSKPATKKIRLMTKKFKKTPSAPPSKLSAPQRFVITESAIKKITSMQEKYQPMCLVLLEVDEFKNIAKEIGSDGEGKLLSHLQAVLKSHQRNLDKILPQGSGRFLMILPHTSHPAAVTIAETLRKAIHEKPFSFKSHHFSLFLSVGVVTLDKNSQLSKNAYEQFGTMLKKVDKALQAKRKKSE